MEKLPKIIFVDDEKFLLESMRRYFMRRQQNDWDLHFETDPNQVVKMQSEESFDVVITDFYMPKLDGIALSQKLHAIDLNTEIIMLSGTADMDTAVQIINSTNIFRFYSKPCAPETLHDGINDCLISVKEKLGDTMSIGNSVLDRLAIGIIVCSTDGHVIHANQTGMLICSDNDGLYIDLKGNLHTTQSKIKNDFAQALNASDKGKSMEFALSIDRLDVDTPLNVVISPMNTEIKSPKLILISAPEKHIAPSEKMLQSMYAMPPSEAKLLHLIVSGYQLKSAAEKLNITEGSARTYLKRIFSRTETNSQPELIRTILMTPGICDL